MAVQAISTVRIDQHGPIVSIGALRHAGGRKSSTLPAEIDFYVSAV